MLQNTFVRYVIVGLLSVGIDYGLLLFGYHVLGMGLAIATTASFLIGLIANFLLNKFWSFDTGHTTRQSINQAVLYVLLVGFNLLVTNLVVLGLSDLHIGPEISKIFTTAMITAWNYILYKKFIFKTPPPVV